MLLICNMLRVQRVLTWRPLHAEHACRPARYPAQLLLQSKQLALTHIIPKHNRNTAMHHQQAAVSR